MLANEGNGPEQADKVCVAWLVNKRRATPSAETISPSHRTIVDVVDEQVIRQDEVVSLCNEGYMRREATATERVFTGADSTETIKV